MGRRLLSMLIKPYASRHCNRPVSAQTLRVPPRALTRRMILRSRCASSANGRRRRAWAG